MARMEDGKEGRGPNKEPGPWREPLKFVAALSLFLLAMAAAFRLADKQTRSAPAQPPPSAKVPPGAGAKAPAASPKKQFHKIPYGVFESTRGLRVGIRMEGVAGGKRFIGIVTAIGKDDVTVEVKPPVAAH